MSATLSTHIKVNGNLGLSIYVRSLYHLYESLQIHITFIFPITMVMFSILCCFRKKPASPSQVVETGKKISPLLPPPQVTKTAKKQPTPPGLNKRITVKDGGLIVSKSSKTTTKSSLRRTRYGNNAGGFGGCGGGCGGGC